MNAAAVRETKNAVRATTATAITSVSHQDAKTQKLPRLRKRLRLQKRNRQRLRRRLNNHGNYRCIS